MTFVPRTFSGWLVPVAITTLSACGSASQEPDDACADVGAASCAVTQAMQLSEVLPPARGNAYGDSDDAAMFGFSLFFDPDLGSGVGCATCHAPELAFTDRKSVSTGKGTGNRNAPTTFNPARLSVIFWDGRADSLWSQPLFAIENPLEMASSRLELAHTVADDAGLRVAYETVFGPLPDMSDWPAEGKPGDAAFDTLDPATQTAVNRVAANVGKGLEAYQRKNSTGRAPFDAFLAGDATQIIDVAQRGLSTFIHAGCTDCHRGPMLTDERFHDVGFPSLAGAEPDPGRADAANVLDHNIFNLSGEFADAEAIPAASDGAAELGDSAAEETEVGAFRTPSLRNVARTAPYGHDGALATLTDVLVVHAPELDEEQRGSIIAFLQTLNGSYPARPWSDWPAAQ